MPSTPQQVFRFVLVGVLATAVNYGVFYLLLCLALPYAAAAALGFIAGVAAGFPLNRRWTFAAARQAKTTVIAAYFGVYTLSLLAGQAALWGLVEGLRFSPLAANLVSIGITTLTNFIGVKFWVFRHD